MKLKFSVLPLALALSAHAAIPYVTDVGISGGGGSREATVTYVLHGAPAVVTFDIQTNVTVDGVTSWASIGAGHLATVSPDSAAFRRVLSDGAHAIKWSANDDTCNINVQGGSVRAVVTAWALDDTPDWMVLDLSSNKVDRVRYYPTAEHLPGGILSNREYRASLLAMRRIHARGVPWTRGSAIEPNRETREATHTVTLTNDYYISVFPITQAQHYVVAGSNPSFFVNMAYKAMRPVEKVSWSAAKTFLEDALSARTGFDFTLPSESQWEFACRAGNGELKWGDGSRITTTAHCPNVNGRYAGNGGYPKAGDENYGNTKTNQWTAANGTAECGSYAPNSWGIYDMSGNVTEWCSDWFTEDVLPYNGAPVNVEDPTQGGRKACRGGTFEMANVWWLRPARRDFSASTSSWITRGVRAVCRAGLK